MDNDIIGHRQRLKNKYLESRDRSFPDYEILEMMLYSIYPRRDTKEMAKQLLSRFGTLKDLYLRDIDATLRDPNLPDSLKLQIKLINDLFTRLVIDKGQFKYTHVLDSWNAVLQYLKLDIGFKEKEQFIAIYLNKRNYLINKQNFDSGTVDKVAVYPREILKGVVHNNASAVIVAHNHPSGDASPSTQDIRITKIIQAALEPLEVALYDHVILANDNFYSFKNHGLL